MSINASEADREFQHPCVFLSTDLHGPAASSSTLCSSSSAFVSFSQTQQPGFVQQLHQQQHGEPSAQPAAQPHRGSASGSDQTAHDAGNHHQTHRVGSSAHTLLLITAGGINHCSGILSTGLCSGAPDVGPQSSNCSTAVHWGAKR